jgi:uncharacterized protein YggE
MRHSITIALSVAVASLALSLRPALADPAPTQTLSITGTGSVDYAPDIARESFGVRAESASAAAAARSVNERAQAVIAALRKMGIADHDIATTGYSIQYQQPDPSASADGNVGMAMPASQAGFPGEIHRPLPHKGVYIATETIDVKSLLDKAGAVLDAAVGAGANETYGLTFDTSARDLLYRKALARAVASARAQAEILSRAAGVTIAGIQSISAGGNQPMPMFRMAAPEAAPPIMGGTGTIAATVDVVYRIK